MIVGHPEAEDIEIGMNQQKGHGRIAERIKASAEMHGDK
jgi:hypothetical protein